MSYEHTPDMERFEFNATPEQASEALRELDRIMQSIPLDQPPKGIGGPANKIRTYKHASFAYYPDGMRYLPDDTSIVYGVIETRHDDGSTDVFTIRQELAHDLKLTHYLIGPLNNYLTASDTNERVRSTDSHVTQTYLRTEREWGLAELSFSDADGFIERLKRFDPLDPRSTTL